MRSLWMMALAGLVLALPARGQSNETLLADLAGADAWTRQGAERLLEDRGPAVVPDLARLLWGKDMRAHRSALQVLRSITWKATRPGAAPEKRAVAAALLGQAKDKQLPAAARNSLLELASLVAGDESIGTLQALMADKDVRVMARFALARVPGPTATAALRAALKAASDQDPFAIGLVTALGDRHDLASAPLLRRLMSARSSSMATAAVENLGRIPDPLSAAPLWKLASTAQGRPQTSARRAYVELANLLARAGNTSAASGMYWKLLGAARSGSDKCAALLGLSATAGLSANQALLGSLGAPEADVRGLVAQLLGASKDPAVTAALVRASRQGKADTRVMVLGVLAARAGEAVPGALFGAAADKDPRVRVAAYQALMARKGLPAARLLAVYHAALPKAADDDERRVLLSALGQVADPSSLPVLKACMATPSVRSDALAATLPIADRLAQAGKRSEAVALYQQALQGGDATVVRQAARQLGKLGIDIDLTSQLGFVSYWWVLGPIPGRDQWRQADAVSPESVDLAAPVRVGDVSYRWKAYRLDDPTGRVDLAAALAQRDQVAGYLYAEVTSPAEQDVTFKIGSDDDVVCWVNGKKVHQFLSDRAWSVDQDSAPVHLSAGVNRLLVKVLNGGGDWAVSLRIVDKNGDPLELAQRKR